MPEVSGSPMVAPTAHSFTCGTILMGQANDTYPDIVPTHRLFQQLESVDIDGDGLSPIRR